MHYQIGPEATTVIVNPAADMVPATLIAELTSTLDALMELFGGDDAEARATS